MAKGQDMLAAVESAANLVSMLWALTSEFSHLPADAKLSMIKKCDPELEVIERSISNPKVADAFSLANSYPAMVQGQPWRSHLEGVYYLAKNTFADIRQAPNATDRQPIDLGLVVHLEKEYERATGKACTAPSLLSRRIDTQTAKILKLSSEGLKPGIIAGRLCISVSVVTTARNRYPELWKKAAKGE